MNLDSIFLRRSKFLVMAMLFIFIAGKESISQSWVGEAQQSGFIIKKVVSDTTIATGQPFSYTLYFTIPAGSTNISIIDQIPPSLMFLGHTVTTACGTPTVTAPAINSMGGTFSINWSSIPGGCTGSITISVAFPNGITCPGTSARNRICMMASLDGKNYDFCTPYISTSAQASNPWGINKYPLGVAWQGGACQYLTSSDTITWQVCVYKSVGLTGQLNLVNGIVTDTLPTGAQLISSTCGATQSGNIITWNVGNMSATQMYNTVCCQFTVHYPAAQFPDGSLINNKATLSGSLGSPNQPCSNFTLHSNQPCVEKKNITSGTLSKWVYTNRQPGCSGQYLIYICNNGTTTVNVSALDTLPTQLSNFSISGSSLLTGSISGGIANISGTLAPGQCGYIYIAFTIPQNAIPNTTVTNCATMTIGGNSPQTTCVSFVIDTPAPKSCLWKEVCNKQTVYTPGSVFRYRLRIQNIGGLPIVGSTLTDVLNSNLEYVGNPTYYTSNAWNTPCTTNPTNPWSGVNLSYNAGTNTVTATLDTIPATCQNIFYTSCGMYGTSGVPFYFIEFDVKVRDTSALGNVPNNFSLGGGTLGSTPTTSNTDYILVSGVVGYNLEKGVKKPSDANYASTATTTAGSLINYRLKMNSSGTAALRHVTVVDLLPLDAGTSDSKILQGCGARGSQFDVVYSSLISASPTISSTWNNTGVGLANINVWTPTGAPGASFNIGCGTVGSWTSTPWALNQKNLGAYLGSTAIGSGGATIDFAGLVSTTAKPNETACNTFAVSGWTKHLIQSSIPNFQLAGQLESSTACITIDSVDKPKPCIEVIDFKVGCRSVNAAGQQTYVMSINANSCTPATLLLSSPDGNFSPASFTFTSSPWVMNTTFTHTSGNNPIKINYTLICKNEVCRDSIFRDLPPCEPQEPIDECCVKFIREIEKPKITSNNSTGIVGLSVPLIAGPSPIKKFSATIVSAQLRKVCWNNAGSWSRIYGDILNGSLITAPAAGLQLLNIYSREAVWGPGECIDWRKGAQLDLKMIFPPFSGNYKCYDSLMFKIRYSFTDCECRTCDTIVTYTVVRKWKFLPWDIDLSDLLIKHSKNKVNDRDIVHSEMPNQTSIVMDDKNNGDLWIISPDEVENDVKIIGAEIQSLEVPLTDISNDGNQGFIEGNVSFITLDINKGESSAIKMKFDNTQSKMKFMLNVRFIYTITGDEDTYYTDVLEYPAIVPGAAPDEMNIDMNTRPEKVKTYALYFNNSNGYNQSISTIALKSSEKIKVLAVGPSSSENADTYLVPHLQEDGSYLISSMTEGLIGVAPKSVVKPIYVTLSGVEDAGSTLQFSTYDDNAQVISNGTIILSNPISKVQDIKAGFEPDAKIHSIVPNPASGIVTINISAYNQLPNVKFRIVDIFGNEVISLLDGVKSIEQGEHIYTIDVAKITSGMYYLVLQTPDFTISEQISIVR